jgi:hypothetical protein
MSSRSWRELRESGFRILLVGLFSLVIAFIIYSRLSTPFQDQPNMPSSNLMSLAWAMLAITAASMVSIGYGAWTIFRAGQIQSYVNQNDGLMSYIFRTFSERKYWKIMIVSAVGYGILFGFLSQIFVYKPDESLTQAGITVPSFNITPCCNAPGYMPMFTAYMADHFLILVIPLNVILAIVVSVLFGFNAALALAAFRQKKDMNQMSRQQYSAKMSFVGGVGAASGLFAGCPTCAGSLFSALLGFSAGTGIAALAQFQTLFILLSIPALIAAPFLFAKQMRAMSSCESRPARNNK